MRASSGRMLLAPHASESQKEPLLGRVAVDLLPFFPGLVVGDHALKCGQSDPRPAVVRGILTKS